MDIEWDGMGKRETALLPQEAIMWNRGVTGSLPGQQTRSQISDIGEYSVWFLEVSSYFLSSQINVLGV